MRCYFQLLSVTFIECRQNVNKHIDKSILGKMGSFYVTYEADVDKNNDM